MGELARTAIFRGSRIESSRLFGMSQQGDPLESFLAFLQTQSSQAIQTCERVVFGESLNEQDYLQIYEDLDITLLLKLVQLRLRRHELVLPRPVVILSSASDLAQYVDDYSSRQDHVHLVVGSWLQFSSSRQLVNLADKVSSSSEFDRVRPVLVGPSLDDLMSISGQGEVGKLSSLLVELKDSGVRRFRATKSIEFARLLRASGFPVSLCSPLDAFPSSFEFVDHLMELRKSQLLAIPGCVWEPGLINWNPLSRADANLNLLLLRALALGSLMMDGKVSVRASSRYFSMEALRLAHLFGATSLGVAAVDSPTEAQLGFLPISSFDPTFFESRRQACSS